MPLVDETGNAFNDRVPLKCAVVPYRRPNGILQKIPMLSTGYIQMEENKSTANLPCTA